MNTKGAVGSPGPGPQGPRDFTHGTAAAYAEALRKLADIVID